MSDAAKSWALLRPLLRPYRGALAAVLLLGGVTAATQASVLTLFEPVWNIIFPAEEAGGSPLARIGSLFTEAGHWLSEAGWGDDWREGTLLAVVAYALFAALVGGAAQYGFTWCARRASYGMVVELRQRLARHLMGLSVRYHGERRFGDLLSRVSSDVTTTLGGVQVALKSLVQEPLFAFGAILVAFVAAPKPTLFILIALPLFAWPIQRLTRKVRKGSTKSLGSLGDSMQVMSQMFQGVRTVKSFGGEARELERFREVNGSYLRQSMRMVRHIALTHSWTAFFSIAGMAVMVGLFGWLNMRYGYFGGGDEMAVFFVAIARLNNHVKNVAKALTRVQESMGAAVRLNDLFAERVELVEAQDPVRLEGLGSGIRFEGVRFRYPRAETDALAGIDLELRPGETLALVGPSGSGKSTLMDLLARFLDPTEGRITVDGHDLRDVATCDWVGHYGLVGQVPFLFHASIGENVRYGRPEASDEDVVEAARAANIHDFVAALPEGYATDVADMGARLSGGQRQRITIARALLKGAPLLLLDEATSALDSESEVEVQRALERLMADRTVLVIAHRLATIKNADRIAVLEQGRVVEVGNHQELLARQGAYARLVRLQELGSEDATLAPRPPVGGGEGEDRGTGADASGAAGKASPDSSRGAEPSAL